jgi:Outer membrane protein beta-barrel domain
MRIVLLLILGMLPGISAFTQSGNSFQAGQLVLKNGETKAGLIFAQFQNNKALRFKSTENASETSFELNQIVEVRIGSQERYVPYCAADASCQWLTTLLECKVNLHRSASETSVYYLEEEGSFYTIKLTSLAGVVTALQNKCAGFKAQNKQYRFTSSSLIEMASDYCQCKYPDQGRPSTAPKTYQEKTAKFYLGLQLGLNQGSTAMEENLFSERYFKGGGFRDQLGFSFGIPAELQIGKHLAIQTGLHLVQRSTLRDSVNINFTYAEFFNQIKFSLTYLDIPLLVQYRFGTEKLEPFVQVGAQIGVPLSRKFIHTPYDPSLDYDTPFHVFQAMGTGLRAEIGVNKSLNTKMKLQLLGQYIRYSTFFEHTIPAFIDGDQINSSVFQISGGLMWRMGK